MENNLRAERLKKLKSITEKGLDPYPARVNRSGSLLEIAENFSALSKKKKKLSVVGRIFSIRGQGGILFLDLKDESGSLQVLLKKDTTKDFDFIKSVIDIGDFIQADGKLLKTKRGEKSIEAQTARVVSKALLPIPSEWYGISDIETRLRKRYLDLLMNRQVRETFEQKTRFWAAFRDFLKKENFLEVETPVLESVPGGADAEPFVTHHKALDIDLYLRISLELPLKRLLVGGFEKVFEIGRIFRNEGIDAEHLQDYTQLEYYWAYQDYEGGMRFVEKMYKHVIKATLGKLKTKRGPVTLDWAKKWKRVDYYDFFKQETGLDLAKATTKDLTDLAKKMSLDLSRHAGKGRVIDLIFKQFRHKLVQPCFLVNPPVEIEPLAKRVQTKPERVERFQVVAAGTELGKGFSELNDPLDQKARFEEQQALRKAGDEEAQRMDLDYIEAMEYGMPPNHGFGVSERLFSVLLDKPVRETVLFPTLRPKK